MNRNKSVLYRNFYSLRIASLYSLGLDWIEAWGILDVSCINVFAIIFKGFFKKKKSELGTIIQKNII